MEVGRDAGEQTLGSWPSSAGTVEDAFSNILTFLAAQVGKQDLACCMIQDKWKQSWEQQLFCTTPGVHATMPGVQCMSKSVINLGQGRVVLQMPWQLLLRTTVAISLMHLPLADTLQLCISRPFLQRTSASCGLQCHFLH